MSTPIDRTSCYVFCLQQSSGKNRTKPTKLPHRAPPRLRCALPVSLELCLLCSVLTRTAAAQRELGGRAPAGLGRTYVGLLVPVAIVRQW